MVPIVGQSPADYKKETMKRDLDLLRALLLSLEQSPDRYSRPQIPGATTDEIWGHLELLIDARLVVATNSHGPATVAHPLRLTWAGHEFLDSARQDKRWLAAKKAAEVAGGISFQVLAELLAKYAAQAVGLPPLP